MATLPCAVVTRFASLTSQLAAVFKDHQWLEPPTGLPPFLES